MSFDLKTARTVCDKIKRKNWNIDDGIDIRYLNIQCAEILPAALDEIDRQANRIAELEDALVEERVRYNLLFPEMWNKEDRQDAKQVAREQLLREGKL